jgi:hypothetical protein
MARCPAHRDRNPSLSISEVAGKVLELSMPFVRGASGRIARVPSCRRQRERATKDVQRSRKPLPGVRRVGGLPLSSDSGWRRRPLTANMYRTDDVSERKWADAAERLTLFENLRGVALAIKYRAALKRNARDVRRLIATAMEEETHVRLSTAIVVTTLAMANGDPL